MDKIVSHKPRSYSKLMQASFRLYRASFKKVFLLSLFLAIIAFIPRLLSDLIGQDLFFDLSPYAWHRLWLVVINLVALIFFVAILWHMNAVIQHKKIEMREDLNVGFKKFIFVFIASIIASLIIYAASFIFYGVKILVVNFPILHSNMYGLILVSIILILELFLLLYLCTLFILTAPIIATENKNVISGLVHSVAITWNHALRVFSLQMTPWLVYLIVIFLLKYVFKVDIHLYFIGNRPHTFFGTFVNLIVFALFIPWAAAVELLQLRDLELR